MIGKPRFLVLLSGPLAVGKTTLRDYLVGTHAFDYVRSSAFLLDKAHRDGLPADRRGLQELGDRLDAETDFRWIVDEVALPSLSASTGKTRWLVDAVRKPKQVEHFKALEGVCYGSGYLSLGGGCLSRVRPGRFPELQREHRAMRRT